MCANFLFVVSTTSHIMWTQSLSMSSWKGPIGITESNLCSMQDSVKLNYNTKSIVQTLLKLSGLVPWPLSWGLHSRIILSVKTDFLMSNLNSSSHSFFQFPCGHQQLRDQLLCLCDGVQTYFSHPLNIWPSHPQCLSTRVCSPLCRKLPFPQAIQGV